MLGIHLVCIIRIPVWMYSPRILWLLGLCGRIRSLRCPGSRSGRRRSELTRRLGVGRSCTLRSGCSRIRRRRRRPLLLWVVIIVISLCVVSRLSTLTIDVISISSARLAVLLVIRESTKFFGLAKTWCWCWCWCWRWRSKSLRLARNKTSECSGLLVRWRNLRLPWTRGNTLRLRLRWRGLSLNCR